MMSIENIAACQKLKSNKGGFRMNKVYMSEVILLEVEVRDKLIKEVRERKIGYKELLNNVIKEYFEIKELLESVPAARK